VTSGTLRMDEQGKRSARLRYTTSAYDVRHRGDLQVEEPDFRKRVEGAVRWSRVLAPSAAHLSSLA
jgi:hypothetical protein